MVQVISVGGKCSSQTRKNNDLLYNMPRNNLCNERVYVCMYVCMFFYFSASTAQIKAQKHNKAEKRKQ